MEKGESEAATRHIGWYVGYVESAEGPHVFATLLTQRGAPSESFNTDRLEISIELLSATGCAEVLGLVITSFASLKLEQQAKWFEVGRSVLGSGALIGSSTTGLEGWLDRLSTSDPWLGATSMLADLGITRAIYGFVQPGVPEATQVRSNMPPSWQQRYVECGYGAVDPFFKYCCSDHRITLTGVTFVDSHAELDDAERAFIREASAESGFRAGIAQPVEIASGGGRIGGWNIGGGFSASQFARLFAEHGAAIRTFLMYAHVALSRAGADGKNDATLSGRERDCLLWLARGLQNKQIADRLQITAATVEFHHRNARAKLGASTREHALALALARGLVKL